METFGLFEDHIKNALSGKVVKQDLLQTFWVAEVVVPSGQVATSFSEVIPLTFQKNGVTMLGVFTDPRRIGDFAETAPYFLNMRGSEILKRMPAGAGIVVNPTTPELGLELDPNVIALAVEQMG